MLLTTGPTGNVGNVGNVGNELTTLSAEHAGDRPWRMASRHPDGLRERLSGTSAEVARLDFLDPATWPGALKGVRTLFLLFPLPGDKAAKRAIIPFLGTAEAAGCEHAWA